MVLTWNGLEMFVYLLRSGKMETYYTFYLNQRTYFTFVPDFALILIFTLD